MGYLYGLFLFTQMSKAMRGTSDHFFIMLIEVVFSLSIVSVIPAADKYNLEVSDTLDFSLCLYKVFLLLVDGPSVLRRLLGLPKHSGRTLLLFPNIPSPLRPDSICGWDSLRGRS